MTQRARRAIALLLPLTLFAAACADDKDSTTSTTTPAASSASSASSAPAASGSTPTTGGKLTLYSGRNEKLVGPLLEQFEKASGIDVEVRYGSSAEMGAALMEEGKATPADVFFSQEVGAVGVLAKAGLLTPLPDDVINLVDARYRPAAGNLWVGVTGRSRVIVYNKTLVPEPPKGVEELTDPKWKGQVAIVPGNASFQAFITAFRVSKGEDAARQWLEDMKANGVVTNIESNDDVLTAVDAGQVKLGLINHYYWAVSVDEAGGADKRAAQLVFPSGDDPGGLVNATAVGITNGGGDNPAALEFVKYLMSAEAQEYFATKTFEYPLVKGIANPEGVPALETLQGPQLDLTDLDSLEKSQQLLTELGLLS